MRFQICSAIVVSLICLYVKRTNGLNHHDCFEKLPEEEKKAAWIIAEACKKKLGLSEIPKFEEIDKHDFEDKCFAKCILTESKVLTDKNTVDMEAVKEYLKKAPADKQAGVANIWKECGESTMKAMEAEGGITEKNSCKAAARLKVCFMKDAHKLLC